jgi:hypothetical protein
LGHSQFDRLDRYLPPAVVVFVCCDIKSGGPRFVFGPDLDFVKGCKVVIVGEFDVSEEGWVDVTVEIPAAAERRPKKLCYKIFVLLLLKVD